MHHTASMLQSQAASQRARVIPQLGKQHNFDRALELFLELQMGNMDPTRIVVSAFLGACVENSRPRPARQLIEVCSDVKSAGKLRSIGMQVSNCNLRKMCHGQRLSSNVPQCPHTTDGPEPFGWLLQITSPPHVVSTSHMG